MDEWKTVIADGLHEHGIVLLRQWTEVDDRTGIPAGELLEIISRYDALIVRSRTKVTAELFAAGDRLKVVGRAGVGVDSIDLRAAREHGVAVVNSPIATTVTVAEHTMALLLSLVRQIPRADATMKEGRWDKKQLLGAELYDKTLGIVGMGRIGSAVAQRAGAFRMKVVGYDPLLSAEQIVQNGAQPVGLEELYSRADFISIHAPLTADTRAMVDAETLSQMRAGVRLICAARGGLIDEDALLASLESGHVAGAALDVFAAEPPLDHRLVRHPRVVATPHIGAQTTEAQERAAEQIAEEVLAALRGENLRWQVA